MSLDASIYFPIIDRVTSELGSAYAGTVRGTQRYAGLTELGEVVKFEHDGTHYVSRASLERVAVGLGLVGRGGCGRRRGGAASKGLHDQQQLLVNEGVNLSCG